MALPNVCTDFYFFFLIVHLSHRLWICKICWLSDEHIYFLVFYQTVSWLWQKKIRPGETGKKANLEVHHLPHTFNKISWVVELQSTQNNFQVTLRPSKAFSSFFTPCLWKDLISFWWNIFPKVKSFKSFWRTAEITLNSFAFIDDPNASLSLRPSAVPPSLPCH